MNTDELLARIEKERQAFERRMTRLTGCDAHVDVTILDKANPIYPLAQSSIRRGWRMNTSDKGHGAWVQSPYRGASIGCTTVWFAEP